MKYYILLIASFVLSACTTTTQEARLGLQHKPSDKLVTDTLESPLSCPGVLVYSPLPAFDASNYDAISIKNGKPVSIPTEWPKDIAEINALLPNIASAIGVYDMKLSANIGPFAKGEAIRRKIIMDFMKYRSEPVQDSLGNVFMFSRIGAGLRLTIDITTLDGSLGSGSLLAIAASVKAGLTKGAITADIIGLDARDITISLPFTSDVSEGSIQSIIEALAVIKSKFHDPETNITPQFIAKIECVPGTQQS